MQEFLNSQYSSLSINTYILVLSHICERYAISFHLLYKINFRNVHVQCINYRIVGGAVEHGSQQSPGRTVVGGWNSPLCNIQLLGCAHHLNPGADGGTFCVLAHSSSALGGVSEQVLFRQWTQFPAVLLRVDIGFISRWR